MLPIILVCRDEKLREGYIDNYIKEKKILPYSIYRILPEKKEISIIQVRAIKKEIIVTTSSMRLFIIEKFDSASLEAQNALLKTFEENTQVNNFILLVENEQAVLSTIRSRSKIINLEKNLVVVPIDRDLRLFLESVEKSGDYSFLGNKFITGLDADEAGNFINNIIIYYREKLRIGDIKSTKIIKKAISFLNLLRNNNLNPQLTIDGLLIYIKKAYTIK
ncbi:MAG: polymerase III, delta prime subunit protein [Candidatus Nomurabacteria bacterium GW2011_GWC2_35_8]|uniref:Polymerase III, delta prime subunit protein n=1 Tax=Candidatus Nomurabacteria bacterium GW2011_GWC2_35_8 TaxID=1618752 RepID=A0A0G0FKA3_9BACT|nr:MAG: polymerase III, delta prime subunit protein [Candidatus Nomurabacteria bacterium GW2011_GWC2_35_8]